MRGRGRRTTRSPYKLCDWSTTDYFPIPRMYPSSAIHHSISSNLFSEEAKEESDQNNFDGYFWIPRIHPSSAIHKEFSTDDEDDHINSNNVLSQEENEEDKHIQQQQPQTKKPKWCERAEKELWSEKKHATLERIFKCVDDDQHRKMEAQLVRAKSNTETLVQENKKIAYDLPKTKEELESYKEKNKKIADLQIRKEELEFYKVKNKKIADDLQNTKVELESYKEKHKKIGDDMQNTKEELEFYKETKKKITNDLLKIKDELDTYKWVIKTIKNNMTKKKEELDSYKQVNKEIANDLLNTKDELDSLKQINKKITDDLQKTKEELELRKQKNELDLRWYKTREAECVRAKQETEQLAVKNNKIADELWRAEEEVKSYKQKMEQKCNQLEALQTQVTAMQEDLEHTSHALVYFKAREGRFDDLQTQCVTAREKTQQLNERNNKVSDDLVKTKEEVQFYKEILEQKSNALEEMNTAFAALTKDSKYAQEQSDINLVALQENLRCAAEDNNRICKEKDKLAQDLRYVRDSYTNKSTALEQDLKCANEVNNQICKEKDKMAEDLKYTGQQLEYYNQINHLKSALKGLAEFPGLKQVLLQKNGSDPESSVKHTIVDTKVHRKRRYVLKIYEMEDSLNCPICLEAWNESGEHNICSLPCGHFFGRSCITSWFKKSATGSPKCPLCSKSATIRGIRNHYLPQTFVANEEM